MNIRFIGIDGLGGHEVKRIFSTLTDFDFIRSVGIREFNNSCFDISTGEVLDVYDVNIEIEPVYRDDVSIHIFDNSIYIVDSGRDCRNEAFIHINRSAYERVEII